MLHAPGYNYAVRKWKITMVNLKISIGMTTISKNIQVNAIKISSDSFVLVGIDSQ